MKSTTDHEDARMYVLINAEQINRLLDSMGTRNRQPFFARLEHLPLPGDDSAVSFRLADVDDGDQKDAVDSPDAVVPSRQKMPPSRVMPDGEVERDDDNNDNDNESSNDADKKHRKYKDIDAEDDDANDNSSKCQRVAPTTRKGNSEQEPADLTSALEIMAWFWRRILPVVTNKDTTVQPMLNDNATKANPALGLSHMFQAPHGRL